MYRLNKDDARIKKLHYRSVDRNERSTWKTQFVIAFENVL